MRRKRTRENMLHCTEMQACSSKLMRATSHELIILLPAVVCRCSNSGSGLQTLHHAAAAKVSFIFMHVANVTMANISNNAAFTRKLEITSRKFQCCRLVPTCMRAAGHYFCYCRWNTLIDGRNRPDHMAELGWQHDVITRLIIYSWDYITHWEYESSNGLAATCSGNAWNP